MINVYYLDDSREYKILELENGDQYLIGYYGSYKVEYIHIAEEDNYLVMLDTIKSACPNLNGIGYMRWFINGLVYLIWYTEYAPNNPY
jgi:hypothetical protein